MQIRQIILFDGVCNLCNGAVQFVIKHDPHAKFTFASLQSETGKNLLEAHNLPTDQLNSFVLIQGERSYTRSTAALKVVMQLTGLVKILYGFIIVPVFIRNAVYQLIAKNRYKWFGKKEACMIPSPSLKQRFLN
ncbi:MAG: thiol-disulfide oxidoreductase DCC family protein [Ferruginibacter sp.]|nr:thiol-disulfide oxidoreductase DCC family protein [Ferruginibacter sp.]